MNVRAGSEMILVLAISILCGAIVDVRCESFFLRGRPTSTTVKSNVADSGNETTADEDVSKPDLYSFSVTSSIAYRYAITTVSSRVANRANTSKEISFTVTLPESAFISKFLMVINDTVYEAYVKEKEEAKKDYQAAVSRGETAGHVEMNSRNSKLFMVSVNVESRSKVTFNLTYEQLLTRTLSYYEHVINVDPGQIVKSFQVRINVEESAPIVFLEVPALKIGTEIDSTDSKSIHVRTERPTNNTARITWAPDVIEQEEMFENGVKGQFILRYDIDRSVETNEILVGDCEGYFVHFFTLTTLETLHKHVLFVLDVSGSMAGRSIEQLRQALDYILNDIGEGDYFSLILFSTDVQVWTLNGLLDSDYLPAEMKDECFIIPASKENIVKAKAFARQLEPLEATNIIAALRRSLQIANFGQTKERPLKDKPIIIFLTDGKPNEEMSDGDEIVKTVKRLNTIKCPIFSLALGEEADYNFLRKLSLSNFGFAKKIYVASDTSLQLKNFYKDIAFPLLSNVSFTYDSAQVVIETLTKSSFKNLYRGSELIVTGRLVDACSNDLDGNVTAVAQLGQVQFTMPLRTSLKKTSGRIGKMWAYMYIKEMFDKYLISDQQNSIYLYKQRALGLSLNYGYVTAVTSLVVVKPKVTSNGDTTNTSPNQYYEEDSLPYNGDALSGGGTPAPIPDDDPVLSGLSAPAPIDDDSLDINNSGSYVFNWTIARMITFFLLCFLGPRFFLY